MIGRDYILRMIQQLTAAIAKVLFRRELKQYDNALEEIDEACERLIGMKWNFLRGFSDQQLIELLGYERNQDKMLAVAELLREESDILELQGKTDESIAQGMKAFSLFTELITAEKSFLEVIPLEKYRKLDERLSRCELPLSITQKRFRYLEAVGRFAAAEDVLYEIVDHDRSFAMEGLAFYDRLMKKSETELINGGLPPDEVQEGKLKMESLMKTE